MDARTTSSPDEPSAPFSDAIIDALIADLRLERPGQQRRLRRYLRDLPAFARTCRSVRGPVPPGDRLKANDLVYRRAGALLAALGVDPASGLRHRLPKDHPTYAPVLWHFAESLDPKHPEGRIADGTAERAFSDALRAVHGLRAAGLRAKHNLKDKVKAGRGGDRREVDWALEEVTRYLISIYQEVTGRPPRSSVTPATGEAGGPMIRFLKVCLAELGWRKSETATRALARRVLKKGL